MTIAAEKVKELRERTGAGMMECKKALVASQGDIDKAIEAMRKSGQAKADKKAGRIAAEGIIVLLRSADNKHAVIIEINCETDFVARDESFKKFAEAVAATALASKIRDVESLSSATLKDTQMTVEQARQQLVAKIGENVQIRRLQYIDTQGGAIGAYVHGGRIGVLIDVQGGDEELRKDLAMHIAASNPRVIAPSEVPEDLVAKEKEIFMAQASESGKPADIVEKMIGGRIKKFLDEVSLLGQPFVKDPAISVSDLLKKSQATTLSFIRFEVGEGIEKKTENFAEEVMAQVRGD